MRYIPNMNPQARLTPGSRPPLDLVPKTVAALLTEHDRLFDALALARKAATAVTGEEYDREAQLKDEAAAATAARAGSPIPDPAASLKLAADRLATTRALAAHEAAFAAVTNDLNNATGDAYFGSIEDATKARTKALAGIDNLVDQLATAVETAVSAGAARDWLRGGYYPAARAWAVDAIPDLARLGLHHNNSGHYPVRDILRGTCHTVLEDD